mgnify:CR=1 FL=1
MPTERQSAPALLNRNRNPLTHHRWVVRDVDRYTQHQLQHMLPLRERTRHLGLAAAEMLVVAIRRQRIVQVLARRSFGVDQQVVVTSLGLLNPRRRTAHAREPELHQHRTFNRRPISQIDEIHASAVTQTQDSYFR